MEMWLCGEISVSHGDKNLSCFIMADLALAKSLAATVAIYHNGDG